MVPVVPVNRQMLPVDRDGLVAYTPLSPPTTPAKPATLPRVGNERFDSSWDSDVEVVDVCSSHDPYSMLDAYILPGAFTWTEQCFQRTQS